ncbi:MAG TPA: C13 family peptidase [Steroidobacteraceae bacterium]|nr:C13 family peptidase [Steroidobacteraceae bacterium]
METITIHSKLTEADWRALCMAAGARMSERAGKRGWADRAAPLVTWLIITATMVFLFSTTPPLVRPLGAAILLAAIGLFWWWVARRRMKSAGPEEGGAFLGEQSFEFSAEGFRVRRSHSDTMNRWMIVRDVQEGDAHIFIWIDRVSAYLVPARDLPLTLTAGALATRLRELMSSDAAAPRPAPDALSTSASTSPELPADPAGTLPAVAVPLPTVPSMGGELVGLFRLYGWGTVDRNGLYGREITLAFLGGLSVLLLIGLQRVDFDVDVALSWWGISGVACAIVAIMAVAWLLARFSTPRLELRRGMLLVLGITPPLVVANWVLEHFAHTAVCVVLGVLAVEAFLYLKRGLRVMSGAPQVRALLLATVAGSFMLYGMQQPYLMTGFWFPADVDDEDSFESTREDQQLVFEQSSRIDAAVSSMEPRTAGKSNFFFLGFAGYGMQRVFAQEIDLAARTVGKRFQVEKRSLQLVNDSRDGSRHPFATPPALRHALAALGSRMNPDEDVLFLSLSSHGSKDARISVASEFGYWPDLEARDLASMLREAGIRSKIIVISACYAGSFIDALKDDDSIVITAAAADRTSFGCGDDSELTYFGEAFYRDALPRATDLPKAFEDARAIIAARERSENVGASNPQAWFGKSLVAKLAAMEKASAD